MAVSDADVRYLLTQPEGQQLEFKGARSILRMFRNSLPQLIAGFANANGGVILFGNRRIGRANISPHNPLLGLDEVGAVQQAVEIAVGEVEPRPLVDTSVHDIDGQTFVAVEVPPGSDPPYVGAGAAAVRVGDRLQPLPVERLRTMLASASSQRQGEAMERLLAANEHQARLIESLRSDIARATSTVRQITFGVAFAFLGAVLGVIISFALH